MWSVPNPLYSIFIIPCLTICSATNPSNETITVEPQVKMHLVEDIVRKVCNISLNTLSTKNLAEKAILFARIEEKLSKSARDLGLHGTKYIDLIMKGVKLQAFQNSQDANYKLASENKQAADRKKVGTNNDIQVMNILRTGNENSTVFRTHLSNSNPKGELVNNITAKIELIAEGYLKNAKTKRERELMMDTIKKMFMKSAGSKHNNDDIKTYIELVAKGIDLVMKRDETKRKRMEFVYTHNINLNKDVQNSISDNIDPIKPDSPRNNRLDQEESNSGYKPKSVFLRMDMLTTLQPKSSCEALLSEVCQKIKLLKTLRCQSDNREFNILKLCDGVGDCLDFSDEAQCGSQVIEIIHTANRLMAYLDTSINAHHCFPDLWDKSMLLKQNKLLSDVLESQFTFLEKHSVKGPSTPFRRVYNAERSAINEAIHEAVNIVDSLTSALGMSVCPNFKGDNDNKLDKEDLEKEIRDLFEKKNEQEICKCNGQNCLKKCSPRCGSICLDIYILSQFACEAVSGETVVSLDMVCDGKLDCYDELDEKDCSEDNSIAKFEATHMYKYVLKEIELKTAAIPQEAVRSRLQSLYALVAKLQKASLKRQPDVLELKRIRQTCFAELSKVYDSALISMKLKNQQINIRLFLATMNERLISALKRSNTGNDKIISSDGCVCRNNKCALPRCSKSCVRACSAEPQLTRFFCGELSDQLNNSLPIELICNGKANCPNGEDEKDCKKEVCRTHHLLLLRYKLQDAGKKYTGTALGEALRSWRIKVTATLLIAENNARPTQIERYAIIRDVLHDLVMTYAVLEDRRDNTQIFNEFYSLSRIVIDTLKSCTQ